MNADDLKELLLRSPTEAASRSALVTLRALARDGDDEAASALLSALASELGHEGQDIPTELRVYASALRPREFFADQGRVEDAPTDEHFEAFQRMVRRGAVLQDEILKSFVLCAYTAMLEMNRPGDGLNLSPGGVLSTLDRILNECHVGAGHNAEASLMFGREMLLSMRSAKHFLFVVLHELGHSLFDMMMGRSETTPSKDDLAALPAIGEALPGVVKAARTTQGPLTPGDPRGFLAASGLSMLCSHQRLAGGAYFHCSFTREAGVIDLSAAAVHAHFVISVLGIDPDGVAAAYSPRGVFHFGWTEDPGTIKPPDLEALAEASADAAGAWIDALQVAGRLGDSEGDIPVALGVVPPVDSFFGMDADRTIGDLNFVHSMRAADPLPPISNADAATLLVPVVRCADATQLRRVVATRTDPAAFLRGIDLPLSEAGASLCAVRRTGAVVYHGPTVENIRELLRAVKELGGQIDATRESLLGRAVGRGSDLVEFLLACGADPNRADSAGETPILACARYGSVEEARALLDAGASLAATDEDGATSLHLAVGRRSADLAALLIDRGADPDAVDRESATPLMVARTADTVERLCEAGADVQATTLEGRTALHAAAVAGLADVVRVLLARGADASAPTRLGEAPVHSAVQGGDMECLKVILESGADVDEETNDGITPLMVAARLGNAELLDMLLARGSDPEARTVAGATALLFTCSERNRPSRDFSAAERVDACIRRLVEAGADVDGANDDGTTPLTLAVLGFDAGAVELLLELGADPECPGANGWTPLAAAAVGGHAAMVEAILKAGASVDVLDKHGETALLRAIRSDRDTTSTVRALLDAGASAEQANRAGETARAAVEKEGVRDEIRELVRGGNA